MATCRDLALGRGPKLLQLFDGRGEIRIGKQGPFALGFQHAMAHRVAFAAVAGVLEYPRAGGSGGLGGAVARAVVHNQGFRELPTGTVEVPAHFVQSGWQAALFVVRRNDNGDRSPQNEEL